MKEEIKEILDFIKKQIEKETLSYEPDVELSKEEAKLLLDYITNLQTIEQQYSAILSENAELENKITNLQEENKNLKLSLKNRIKYSEELDEKTLRIKKAIEYIKENSAIKMGAYGIPFVKENKLLNILKGDKDE